jgi:hypothetical protein
MNLWHDIHHRILFSEADDLTITGGANHKNVHTNTAKDVTSGTFLSDFFTELFDGDDLQSLSEMASLAILDVLTAALVADGYPEQEEIEEFRTQVELLPFIPDDRAFVQARIHQTIATLHTLEQHEHVAYLHDVSQHINSMPMKERALRMAVAVSHADFAITRNEHTMLHNMGKGFGISLERTKDIIQDVRAQQEDGLLY